jgi:hypothetical protein
MQVTRTPMSRRLWPGRQRVERLSIGHDVEECVALTTTANRKQEAGRRVES